MVTRFTYVVVGSGIAGTTAVETLRMEDDSVDIGVVADTPLQLYNRPLLKNFLTGSVSEEKLWMRPKTFYQDQFTHFINGRVRQINVHEHTIDLVGGKQIGYERLLLATGTCARQLSCPEVNMVGVTTLHSIDDYKKVLNYLSYVQRVVVTGNGPRAIESVEALRRRGHLVTHLLPQSTLWPEVLDKKASDLVLQQEWRDGIDVRTGEEIAEIVGQSGRVTGVITTKGTFIACELVIVAIGTKPELDYMEESGIACKQGILVDGTMKTNGPDIYAAGDAAEVSDATADQSPMNGHWYTALQQGRAAAYSMLEILDTNRFAHPAIGNEAYTHAIHSMSLYAIDFAAVGLTRTPQDGHGYQEIVTGPKAHIYRKVLLKHGVAVGMLSLGEATDLVAFKRAIDHRVNLMPIAEYLFADDFKFTDWLDHQKVPTPVLAVSKTRNATRTRPMSIQHAPAAKSQFAKAIFYEQLFKEQDEDYPTPMANTNPYLLPIVTAPGSPAVTSTRAFLVPVIPDNLSREHQAAHETDQEYIDPLWKETPLSQTQALTIGREADAALFINHYIVSRHHAIITYANGYYLLCDLGSKNGTFLNDARLQPHRAQILQPDDTIRFGTAIRYELQFRPLDHTGKALS